MNRTKTLIMLTFLSISLPSKAKHDPPMSKTESPPPVVSNQETPYGLYFDKKTGNYFSNGNSSFSIRPRKDTSYLDRIEVSINEGPFQPYTGQLNLKQEGFHKIRFRAVDPVLNWSPVQTFSIFVDLKPPVLKASWKGKTYDHDKKLYISPEATLNVSAEDALSGVSKKLMQVGDQPPVPLSTSPKFSAPGPYIVKLAAVDNVGNQTPWEVHEFVVDAKPPVSSYKFEGPTTQLNDKIYITFETKISLSAEDDASGVADIEYKVDSGTITKYKGPFTVSSPVATIAYRAIDNVGNEEPWKQFTVYRDSKPPQIHLSKNGTYESVSGSTYATPGFSISVTAEDSESGLKEYVVSRNGKIETTKDNKFIFNEPGTYTFEIKAYDNVGNVSEISPMTVVIDNKPPQSTAQSTEKLVQKGDVFLSGIPNQLTFTSKDEGVGVGRIEYSYDGKKFFPVQGPLDFATWNEKKRTVYYRAVDRLGNVEETKSMTIELLTTGPAVDLFVENQDLPQVPLSHLLKTTDGEKPEKAGGPKRGVANQ